MKLEWDWSHGMGLVSRDIEGVCYVANLELSELQKNAGPGQFIQRACFRRKILIRMVCVYMENTVLQRIAFLNT